MIRFGIIALCFAVMAGCSGAVSAPTASAPTPAVQPTVVVPQVSDGAAVPLTVITNLPQGVSATSVTEDGSGCFFYSVADQTIPVMDSGGAAICRG